jgi:dihydrofolate reductase
MRKLILQEFISLDGYAADQQGSTSFFEHLTGEAGREIDKDLLEFIHTIDTVLLGANTYNMFVDFWPRVTTREEIVADGVNLTPKIVFSKSLKSVHWGAYDPPQLVPGNAAEVVRKLKQQDGKDMVLWGSISLARNLLRENLIDEIHLRVCPVLLGSGTPLFEENFASKELELQFTKQYTPGVVLLIYKINNS